MKSGRSQSRKNVINKTPQAWFILTREEEIHCTDDFWGKLNAAKGRRVPGVHDRLGQDDLVTTSLAFSPAQFGPGSNHASESIQISKIPSLDVRIRTGNYRSRLERGLKGVLDLLHGFCEPFTVRINGHNQQIWHRTGLRSHGHTSLIKRQFLQHAPVAASC